MKKIFLAVAHFYQRFTSSFTLPTCRFHPACLECIREAIQYHGAFRGLYLGIRRILECYPLHEGGPDPVPLKKDKSASKYPRRHNH